MRTDDDLPLFVLVAEPVIVRAGDRARAIQMYRNYLYTQHGHYTVRLSSFSTLKDANDTFEKVVGPLPEVDDGVGA